MITSLSRLLIDSGIVANLSGVGFSGSTGALVFSLNCLSLYKNALNFGNCSSGVTKGKIILPVDTKKTGTMFYYLLSVHLTPFSNSIGR
jgi:hypothetical protein